MSRPTISATVSGPSGNRRRGAFEDSGYAGSAERLLDDHGPSLAVGMSLRSLLDAYIAMGADRGERGVDVRYPQSRAGRVRSPLAEPRRAGDQEWLLLARDHPGRTAGRHHRGLRRRPSPRCHSRRRRRLKPVFRPDGTVQVPGSALLVFLVGRATPGYGGERIVDTLIGARVAVIAVLLSPSAPEPDAVMSRAITPLRRRTQILRAIRTGIRSPWTSGQADSWRVDAIGLIDTIAAARRGHEGSG